MSKFKMVLLVLVSVALLAGCGKSNKSARQNTVAQLQKTDQVWKESAIATATVTAQNKLTREKRAADDKLSPWITNNGRFYSVASFKQTTYATVRKQAKEVDSMPQNLHFVTVEQVNATLKVLGAKVRIKSLDDLIYIEQEDATTFRISTGFLIAGDKLYSVAINYSSSGANTAGSSVNRGTVYTRKVQYASDKVLKTTAIQGTWQSAAGAKAVVAGTQLVTVQNDAFVRGKIEDLGATKLTALYTNSSYVVRQNQAIRRGVKLSRNSLVAGDVWGNLYVFLSARKMVQVTNSGATLYTKSSKTADTTVFPDQVRTVFAKLDAQKSAAGVAGYLLPKGHNTYSVGLVGSILYITKNNASGITGAESVSIDSHHQISTAADMNHN